MNAGCCAVCNMFIKSRSICVETADETLLTFFTSVQENSSLLLVSMDTFALLLHPAERNRVKIRGNAARYRKLLASALISKEHQLQLAHFLPFSSPKLHNPNSLIPPSRWFCLTASYWEHMCRTCFHNPKSSCELSIFSSSPSFILWRVTEIMRFYSYSVSYSVSQCRSNKLNWNTRNTSANTCATNPGAWSRLRQSAHMVLSQAEDCN